jgi:hypothetical protein
MKEKRLLLVDEKRQKETEKTPPETLREIDLLRCAGERLYSENR